MDQGWVGNGCGPNRRIGHGYDMVIVPWHLNRTSNKLLPRTALAQPLVSCHCLHGEASPVCPAWYAAPNLSRLIFIAL